MALSSGTLINNRYRIVSILGQGGMGAVYRAIDEHLGISVAVKENLFLTDEYARQFQREASILASLRHSSLPQVRDYFSVPTQGQYLVMDYVEGEDLRSRIERQRILPEKDVILIGIMISGALTYLHTRTPPIVHRDIKPGNIKITPEGEAYLVDFGLAKVMSASQATSTGARAMTPGFSPPEQYGTARTDARTDIYSLGATLYAALTGLIPEDGLARATGKEELTPIRDLESKVNRRLASVIEKALELDSNERYQSAEEFGLALAEAGEVNPASLNRLTIPPPPALPAEPEDEDVLEPPETPASGSPSRQRSSRARRRRKLITRIGYGFVAVALALLFLLVITKSQKPDSDLPLPTPVVVTSPAAATQSNPAVLATSTIQPSATATVVLPSATASSTPTPSPRPSLTSAATGLPQIAFASNRKDGFQIWLMNADGSNLEQLTTIPGGACQPAWAPDGTRIAFVTPCQGKDAFAGGRIFIMDENGKNSGPIQVPNNPEGDYDPAWSPDGSKIAYTSKTGKSTQIYVFDFTTSTTANISDSTALDSNPAWAPNGKLIAFTRETVSRLIWTMSPSGQNQTPFNNTDNSFNSFDPTWTPDGQMVLFSQNKANTGIPWLMARRVSEPSSSSGSFRIPASLQDIGPVAGEDISPDGLWIAYESWPDGKNHEIYRITINGTDLTQLTTDVGYDFGPVWRPK
jgi:eukaryotic-like serine/threonine-protein kinase